MLDCYSAFSNILFISLLELKNVNPASQVNLYPNPTTGIINMDWSVPVENMTVDVYNIIGQGMIHEEINGVSHHETNISALPAGNYMVTLRGNNGNKATYKVMLLK